MGDGFFWRAVDGGTGRRWEDRREAIARRPSRRH